MYVEIIVHLIQLGSSILGRLHERVVGWAGWSGC